MKTPTWAVVIGIILMLFGGCGLLKHSQTIMMPDIMDMQQKMMESALKGVEEADDDLYNEEIVEPKDIEEIEDEEFDDLEGETSLESGDLYADSDTIEEEYVNVPPPISKRERRAAKEMADTMKEMFVLSDFNRKWIIRFGYIGLLVCAIYLMSGAFLVNRNVFGIRFVYGALILSIAFTLIQMLVISSDSGTGFIGKLSSYGNIFGLVVDLILLIVFSVIDKKDYFKSNQPPETAKENWENF